MSYLYLFKYKKSHKNSNFKLTGSKNCCFYKASKEWRKLNGHKKVIMVILHPNKIGSLFIK